MQACSSSSQEGLDKGKAPYEYGIRDVAIMRVLLRAYSVGFPKGIMPA